ncbi:Rieske 2Fe-2S domain-containing protein [Streptomyces sp. NRRL B-24484]|uniref:Rieske 2Fe-2S domain-containing protein n=1 Tax=Streptomyces sp. NRRL B-24484 TaxID=1463833 RepID=UPI0004C2B02C|nr:Rieske 2Fe-2S domain-containing protein [Streptomyces sp. NRRL B-24484]
MLQQLVRRIEGLHQLDGACHATAAWVARATRPRAVKNALSGNWLGHPLHPVLTDLPIGAWTMATLVDVTCGPVGATAARRLVGAGLIAALPTAAAGASDWSDSYGPEQRAGFVHAVCNATATVLQACSWATRRRGRHATGMALSGAGLGLTLAAAYLGGHLSFVRGVGVNHAAFQESVGDWTDVAAVTDLGDGRPLRVTAGGVPVVIVRDNDSLSALSATCTHAGGPLDEGTLDGEGCLRCPWHGSVFRLADGSVVRGPASVAAPRWEVRADDGRLFVRSVPV